LKPHAGQGTFFTPIGSPFTRAPRTHSDPDLAAMLVPLDARPRSQHVDRQVTAARFFHTHPLPRLPFDTLLFKLRPIMRIIRN
jgi:hypothetical protein